MTIFRKVFDFYIYSSLHVGLAVFCLVYCTYFSAIPIHSNTYPFLVFFGTVVGYNFLKYQEWFLFSKKFTARFWAILAVSIGFGFGFLVLLFKQNRTVELGLVFALIFVVTYPFVRKKGWLKLFFVSFVVSWVTLVIPFLEKGYLNMFYFWERFTILSSLMVPFEILDSKNDSFSLQTLPQIWGVANTKIFGYSMTLACFFIQFQLYFDSFFWICFGIDMLIVLAIYNSNLQRNKYYTLFWVESIPIVWFLLFLLQDKF